MCGAIFHSGNRKTEKAKSERGRGRETGGEEKTEEKREKREEEEEEEEEGEGEKTVSSEVNG